MKKKNLFITIGCIAAILLILIVALLTKNASNDVEDTTIDVMGEVTPTPDVTVEPNENVSDVTIEPVETEVPKETEIPNVTDEPISTDIPTEPENTEVPESTEEPMETDEPEVTPEPTKKPEVTPAPTKEPIVVPEITPVPTGTPNPLPTEKPVPTPVPTPIPTPVPTPEPTPEPVCDHELENKTIKEPTCTEYGLEETVCSKCGYSWGTSKINMVDHNFVNGVCTICQHTDETAHKHEWTLTSVTNAPTCGMAGFGAYECSSCGKTQGMEIPPTGQHTYTLLFKGCRHEASEYQCSVCYEFYDVIDSECRDEDGDTQCDNCSVPMN